MRASREELLMESAVVLAKRYGVSERTITRWRRAAGVRLAAVPVKHPERARALVEVLLDEGASLSEAGRTVGVSHKTVRRWFPERDGWSRSEGGSFARAVERLSA